MARVISIHEYDLKPGADVAAFEQAVRDAERRGLFAVLRSFWPSTAH